MHTDGLVDVQRIVVDDHIHGLRLEADEERIEHATTTNAERTPDAATGVATMAAPDVDVAMISGAAIPGFESTETDLGSDPGSVRVRVGRWLVGLGAAIAGETDGHEVRTALVAAAEVAIPSPCDDGAGSMSHAA